MRELLKNHKETYGFTIYEITESNESLVQRDDRKSDDHNLQNHFGFHDVR